MTELINFSIVIKKICYLSIFVQALPLLNGTTNVIRTLEKHGVSMIEIGIPFSDRWPMAL